MATNDPAQTLDIEVALTKSEKFINQYKKQLIGGFAAIIIIALAWFGGHKWLSNREDAAQTQIALGMDYYTSGQWDLALNGDSVKTSKDAFKGFVKIASDYSFTDAANLAHLYAGICYFNKNEIKKSIAELEKFSPKGDGTVSANAIACLGDCYATDNQLDKAVEKFKEAAKKADNDGLSPVYLLKAGAILEKQNKKAEAHELYTKIKTDYPTFQMSATQVNNEVVMGAEIDKYIERTK